MGGVESRLLDEEYQSRLESVVASNSTAACLSAVEALVVGGVISASQVATVSSAGEEKMRYDAWRTRPWNFECHGYPAVVLRPSCTSQVSDIAKALDGSSCTSQFRVMGGGFGGRSYEDGAMLLDMALMNAVTVDTSSMTVSAAGGATVGDVDTALDLHGFVTPLPTHPGIGVVGAALRLGVGSLTRKHGLTCDNIVGAEIVTAAGEIIQLRRGGAASEREALFWDLLTGGVATAGVPFVVTSVMLRCFKAERPFLHGTDATVGITKKGKIEAVEGFSKIIAAASDDFSGLLVMPSGVPAAFSSFVYSGPGGAKPSEETPAIKSAAAALGSVAKFKKLMSPSSYAKDVQRASSKRLEPGLTYDGIVLLRTLDTATSATLARFSKEKLDDVSFAFIIMPLGVGAPRKSGAGGGLVAKHDFVLVVDAQWKADACFSGRERVRQWFARLMAELTAASPENAVVYSVDTPWALTSAPEKAAADLSKKLVSLDAVAKLETASCRFGGAKCITGEMERTCRGQDEPIPTADEFKKQAKDLEKRQKASVANKS